LDGLVASSREADPPHEREVALVLGRPGLVSDVIIHLVVAVLVDVNEEAARGAGVDAEVMVLLLVEQRAGGAGRGGGRHAWGAGGLGCAGRQGWRVGGAGGPGLTIPITTVTHREGR